MKFMRTKMNRHPGSIITSPTLASNIRTITVLKAFVKAHIASQHDLLRYFGSKGLPESCEEARCVLESQTLVYRALSVIQREAKEIDRRMLEDMDTMRKSGEILKNLSHLVDEAAESGAINQQQAHALLSPLEDVHRAIRRGLHAPSYGITRDAELQTTLKLRR
eukprot:CAMPEP_0115191434 /NCGR_PEP_ID=MMETSP0270-20121206/12530_1 /TAXON_ID=71861 /ORGANISM="Scrippsiella trochoidea, Strain CCMP3099" /LENGTH=163 /DNA_ID=CAMNT_0002604659 /DNA_START=1 /DNA_END=489 /DNA_ORIENTATION=+